MLKYFYVLVSSIFLLSYTALAQTYQLDDFTLTTFGSSRTRYEFENWLGKDGQKTDYSFPSEKIKMGFDLKKEHFRFSLAGQYYGIYNLDRESSGTAGVFISANSNSTTPQAFSIRTALLEYTDQDNKLAIGRQNYFNGQGGKLDTKNNDLTYLIKWRIAQRIIGASEFTAGRSYDGVYGEKTTFDSSNSVQAGYFRPTEGSAKVDASRQISDIDIGVLSYTKEFEAQSKQIGQAQIFYYYFGDSRNLTKADNRETQTDLTSIRIHNLGGHWISSIPAGPGTIDTTLWGVTQLGDWGQQKQQSWAGVAELGYHFTEIALKPWFRTGINITSGDDSSSDNTHNTFFQLINTPRNFSLTPFYNMQNMNDQFVQILLYPTDNLSFRSDLHSLKLTNNNDLLYSGAGASKVNAFGYSGVSSNGANNVGTLLDIGSSYKINDHLAIDAYVGHVSGGIVLSTNYKSHDISYGFVDINLSF